MQFDSSGGGSSRRSRSGAVAEMSLEAMKRRIEMEKMVMGFRVTELQTLLGYLNVNKIGKKTDLQERVLEVIRNHLSPEVVNKVRELHRLRWRSFGGEPPGSDDVPLQKVSMVNKQRAVTRLVSSGVPLTSAAASSSSSSSSAAHGSESSVYYMSMPRITSSSSPSTFRSTVAPKEEPVVNSLLPILVDVTFKRLPFYDIRGELLKPATLMPTQGGSRFNESTFSFHLTPGQANQISMSRTVHPLNKVENVVQIQMRFCLMEITSPQSDHFPPSLCVKVNNRMCPLPPPLPNNKPGLEPKRPSKPLDITSLCKISPVVTNNISISWASEFGRPSVVAIFLVKQLTPNQLLQRIKGKGVRNAEYTRAMVKEKLCPEEDSEIATTSLRGSLLCPLGKTRMSLACRSLTCSHIQCFDALLYLQMNEKKPSWICPVCDKPAAFDDLVIDGLFSEIMAEVATTVNEIEFNEDGGLVSWAPVVVVKKEPSNDWSLGDSKRSRYDPNDGEDGPEKRQKKNNIQVITIDSDESDEDQEEEGEESNNSSAALLLSDSSSALFPSQSLDQTPQQETQLEPWTSYPSTAERQPTITDSLQNNPSFGQTFNESLFAEPSQASSSFGYTRDFDLFLQQLAVDSERPPGSRGRGGGGVGGGQQQATTRAFDEDIISID